MIHYRDHSNPCPYQRHLISLQEDIVHVLEMLIKCNLAHDTGSTVGFLIVVIPIQYGYSKVRALRLMLSYMS